MAVETISDDNDSSIAWNLSIITITVIFTISANIISHDPQSYFKSTIESKILHHLPLLPQGRAGQLRAESPVLQGVPLLLLGRYVHRPGDRCVNVYC